MRVYIKLELFIELVSNEASKASLKRNVDVGNKKVTQILDNFEYRFAVLYFQVKIVRS